MPSRGLLRVVEFVAGEVADDQLPEGLHHFTEGYFFLSMYTESYPGDDEAYDFATELVDLVKQAQELEPIK